MIYRNLLHAVSVALTVMVLWAGALADLRRRPIFPAAGAFTCGQISNCFVWYKAPSEAYSNGASVGTLHDQSGNGRDATEGTNTPTFQTNVQNGLSVIRFDGTNDKLATSSLSHGIGTGDFYVAFVAKSPGTINGSFRTAWSNGSFAPAHYWTTSTNSGAPAFYMGGTNAFTSLFSASTWYVVELYRVSGSVNMRVNGVVDATTVTNSSSISNAAFILAADAVAGGDYAGMDLGELLFYNANVSSTDRNTVKSHLCTDWGISCS